MREKRKEASQTFTLSSVASTLRRDTFDALQGRATCDVSFQVFSPEPVLYTTLGIGLFGISPVGRVYLNVHLFEGRQCLLAASG